MALQAISQRTDEVIRFQAAIHGIKLDSQIPSCPNRVELSEAERAAIDKHTEEAIQRKRREMKRG